MTLFKRAIILILSIKMEIKVVKRNSVNIHRLECVNVFEERTSRLDLLKIKKTINKFKDWNFVKTKWAGEPDGWME